MWIVAIAWMYVATMMTVAEASAPHGSWLGALSIFLFYGVLPVSLVMYLLTTPQRRKARKALEARAPEEVAQATPPAASQTVSVAGQDNASGLPPRDAIAPEGKEGTGI